MHLLKELLTKRDDTMYVLEPGVCSRDCTIAGRSGPAPWPKPVLLFRLPASGCTENGQVSCRPQRTPRRRELGACERRWNETQRALVGATPFCLTLQRAGSDAFTSNRCGLSSTGVCRQVIINLSNHGDLGAVYRLLGTRFGVPEDSLVVSCDDCDMLDCEMTVGESIARANAVGG